MSTIIPEEIRAFLEKVIEEKKFDNLSPELKEAMVNSMYPRLQAFIFSSITKELDEETAQELNRMLEGSVDYSQPEFQMFLKGRVKNIEEITAAAMLEFRAVYLNA